MAERYPAWIKDKIRGLSDNETTNETMNTEAEQQAQLQKDTVVFESLMRGYGFDDRQAQELSKRVSNLLVDYDLNTVTSVFLPEEPIFQERFSGNKLRQKKGLNPLSPQEYLTLEKQYTEVLRAYGLPEGFYDDPQSDFAEWLAGDVSPSEIQSRAQVASEWKNNLDPQSKEALRKFYGISEESLVAYALDSKRALPIIQRQAEAAKIGAEALKQNLNVGRSFAEQLSDMDVTEKEARQAFGSAAQTTPAIQQLAALEGQQVSTQDVVEAELGVSPEATRRVRGLASRERARFGGTAGRGQEILGSGLSGSY